MIQLFKKKTKPAPFIVKVVNSEAFTIEEAVGVSLERLKELEAITRKAAWEISGTTWKGSKQGPVTLLEMIGGEIKNLGEFAVVCLQMGKTLGYEECRAEFFRAANEEDSSSN